MFKALSQDAKFRIWLTVLSGIGLALILITTSKYGAGVSSDAARNLSTADSLLEGKGFVDMLGAPLLLWPPLYPLVLAGLSLITGWGTFQSAWYLNVALLVVNIWLAGWFLCLIFRDKPILALIGSLVILLSRSSLRIHANVASEPLFETFLLVFFIAAAGFLESGSTATLWTMFALAGIATLQRYLGIVLIGVGLVVALKRVGFPRIGRVLLPAGASTLPIAAWAVLHNYPASGTFFGPRDLGAMYPLQNIGLSLTKILWWFVPRFGILDYLLLHPWIPLLGLTLVVTAINRRTDWLSWLGALSNAHLWPALLFSVVYFFLLAFTVVTADHLDLTSDRYYIVILPVIVAFVLITIDQLILPHIRVSQPLRTYALGALAFVWFVYPLYSLQAYLRQALVQGEPTNYNIANSANFREMSVVKAGEDILAKDPSSLLYSNYLNIVWFIYHHPVQALPFENESLARAERLAALKDNYPDWPKQSGYIIWFVPNQYHHIVAPDELATIADLRLLYADRTGEIYYVQAKQP
jgi:hypothetical protein